MSWFCVEGGNDCAADPQLVARRNQCRRICLQAGADPTLTVPGNFAGKSLVELALDVGTTVTLLNYGLEFTAANGGEGNATDHS